MKVLVVLALLGVAAAYTASELSVLYTQTKETYGRILPESSESARLHFQAFSEHANWIQDHNENNGSQWQATINEFALNTDEENEAYLGLNVSTLIEQKRSWRFKRASPRILKRQEETVDYTDYLPGVKNQGSCGSCWSFSTTGALEGALWKATKTLVSLSEEQFVQCSSSNNACNGGSMPSAFEFAEGIGVCTEANHCPRCLGRLGRASR